MQTDQEDGSVSISGQYTAAGLQARIDTTELLDQHRRFLSGKTLEIDKDANGVPIGIKEIDTGHSLANPYGVDCIMHLISSVINKHSIQGNLLDTDYNQFLSRAHGNIARDIMDNLFNWGINIDLYAHLVNTSMDLIETVISRTVDNKERESYRGTVEHREVSTHFIPKSGIPYFGGGKNG